MTLDEAGYSETAIYKGAYWRLQPHMVHKTNREIRENIPYLSISLNLANHYCTMEGFPNWTKLLKQAATLLLRGFFPD